MNDGVTLTVRISKETKERLDALADSTRRTRSMLAAEAIATYLAIQAGQAEAVGEAVAAADAGAPFYEHEEVMAYLERRAKEGARAHRPKPITTT